MTPPRQPTPIFTRVSPPRRRRVPLVGLLLALASLVLLAVVVLGMMG